MLNDSFFYNCLKLVEDNDSDHFQTMKLINLIMPNLTIDIQLMNQLILEMFLGLI